MRIWVLCSSKNDRRPNNRHCCNLPKHNPLYQCLNPNFIPFQPPKTINQPPKLISQLISSLDFSQATDNEFFQPYDCVHHESWMRIKCCESEWMMSNEWEKKKKCRVTDIFSTAIADNRSFFLFLHQQQNNKNRLHYRMNNEPHFEMTFDFSVTVTDDGCCKV